MKRAGDKTKVLIVAMSLEIGGAERSLINLLSLLDYSKVDVDLLLFKRKGVLLDNLPKEINLIDVPELDVLYGMEPQSRLSSIKALLLRFRRFFGTGITYLKERQFDRRRLKRWNGFYRNAVPMLDRVYDCAISYSGGETFWYIAEKVVSCKKVIFFHSDYSNIDFDIDGEVEYLQHADDIVAVSQKCAESLRKKLPRFSSKIRIMQNPTPLGQIIKLAGEHVDDGFSSDNDVLKVISIGRLHPIKGFDKAVEAASLLQIGHAGQFEWIIVGDGEERISLEKKIDERSLRGSFRIVGMKENPYPYLRQADVLVQTSLFEGKSVVLDEAAVLGKPIISTFYPSISDQIVNGETGLVVGPSPREIADCMAGLIEDRRILETIGSFAANRDLSHLEDISAFDKLIAV